MPSNSVVFLFDVDNTLLDNEPADIKIERIGNLVELDLASLLQAGRRSK